MNWYALVGVVLAVSPLAALAESHTCTDQDLIDSAVSLAGESSSPLAGKIKILDPPFNFRPNKYFHTAPSMANILADHDNQCAADVMTNRAHMIMYYGWETMNGKTYVSVKLVPKIGTDDDSPAPVAIAPPKPTTSAAPVVASRWSDVLPKVKQNCANDWPDNFRMQAVCIDQQRKGWEEVNAGNIPATVPAPQQPPSATAPTHNYTVSPLSSPPPPAVSIPVVSPPSQGFTDGQTARTQYETWVNSISEGEYRDGVLFWAARRSDQRPPGCHFSSPSFESGCVDSQKRLAPLDARRKGEPDFKLGWNSVDGTAAVPVASLSAQSATPARLHNDSAGLSADMRGAIGDHVRECWTRDAGALDVEKQRVLIKITTDESGRARMAEVAGDDIDRMSDPRFRAFAIRAVRAVMDARCANLPLPNNMLGRTNVLTIRFGS